MLPRLRLQVPTLSARVSPSTTASTLARLIASGAATSKADLVRVTGLSRSTVDAGLRMLVDLHAVRSVGLRESVGRGRRAEMLEVDPDFGVTVVLDFGARGVRVAVFDLGQRLLADEDLPIPVSDGPVAALDGALAAARELIGRVGAEGRPRVTVVGVPGPVDARAGVVVRGPIMPGWDGYDIAAHVRRDIGGVVIISNDVNLRALGEARAAQTGSPLLYVKVSTGIGAGLATASGELLMGADGAAGDIGHLRSFGSTATCRCGRIGCLEATASIAALAAARYGSSGAEVSRFIDDLRAGDHRCRVLIDTAARAIGEVVSELVLFYNPGRVLIGGEVATATDDLLAGVRGVVYSRGLPLATRNLTIELASLDSRAGMAGGVVMGTEAALDADRIADIQAERVLSARRAAWAASGRAHRSVA